MGKKRSAPKHMRQTAGNVKKPAAHSICGMRCVGLASAFGEILLAMDKHGSEWREAASSDALAADEMMLAAFE